MTQCATARPARLKMLHEFFAAATHEASAAMCRWTQGLISITLDEVCELGLEEVCTELNFGDDLLTMVVLQLEGESGGAMVLLFDQANGRRLIECLLDCGVDEDAPWTALEQSVLTETGNILGCAYLNALTRLLSVQLIPTPPRLIQDYGLCVLQQALLDQAGAFDTLLFCRTRFHRADEQLHWQLLFVPTERMRRELEKSLPANHFHAG